MHGYGKIWWLYGYVKKKKMVVVTFWWGIDFFGFMGIFGHVGFGYGKKKIGHVILVMGIF